MKVGQLMRVKPEVWAEWCLRHHKGHKPSEPQPIICVPNQPAQAMYFGYVMLAYPFYWWKEEELEDACPE